MKSSHRLFKPSLGSEELDAVSEAFSSSWVGLGPRVRKFESQWSQYVDCKYSLALNSATAALHLALASYSFPKGSRVLLPSLTFASTATAVLYNGLVPVFTDCDQATLSISLEDLENKYTQDCVCIIIVHYGGHPAQLEDIIPWARDKNMVVIEDCAHTCGSPYRGKSLGTWGDIGCFSFEEKKQLTTGDGGMLCTNHQDIYELLLPMRWIGIDKNSWKAKSRLNSADIASMHWYYEINMLGFKYNMNDLAASIGIVQLKRLPSFIEKRKHLVGYYLECLLNSGLSFAEPLLPYSPDIYPYHLFGLRTSGVSRNLLANHLLKYNIATGCHYTPLSLQPLFRDYYAHCPITEAIYPSMLTLPLHTDMVDSDIEYIVDALCSFKVAV